MAKVSLGFGIIGLIITVAICLGMTFTPNIASWPLYLLTDVLAAITGVTVGYWLILRSVSKKNKPAKEPVEPQPQLHAGRRAPTLGVINEGLDAKAASVDAEVQLVHPAANPDLGNVDSTLGFFDARVADADMRLTLTPKQMEKKATEEEEVHTKRRHEVAERAAEAYQAEEAKRIAAELQKNQRISLTVSPQPIEQAKPKAPLPAEPQKPKTPRPNVLQPEYAIGSGIITRDDYNNLQNEYFAQSELSLGLILPLMLVTFALAVTPQVGLQGFSWLVMMMVLIIMTAILFVVGMERRHKYRLELKLLILGNWDKQNEAADKAKGTDTSQKKTEEKLVRKALREELHEELKQVQFEVKPLVVEVRNFPPEPMSSQDAGKSKPAPTGTVPKVP